MKTIILTSLKFIAVISIVIACKKDTPNDNNNGGGNPNPDNFSEMVVPASFDYKTSKSINYQFDLANAPLNEKYKVEIYNFRPTAGGNLIKSSFIGKNSQLNGELTIPATLKKLYVVLKAPDKSSSLHILPVNGNSLSYSFGSGKKSIRKTQVVSPNCSSGCDVSYTNHNSNVNINSNDPGTVFCINGGFNNKDLNVNKANVTIRVCGNVNFRNVNLNSGSRMEITDGSVVEFDQLSINGSSGELVIYDADVYIENSFSPGGDVTNHGDLEIEDNFNVNGNASLINNGTLTVGIDLNQNKNLTNNGTIEVGDDLRLNGGSTTINNCKIVIDDDLEVNSALTNNAYMFAGDQFLVNGGANVTLVDGAMIEANRATLNNVVVGTGTTSLIKLFDSNFFGNSLETIINGGGGLSGNLEYCDSDGIETNTGSISNGAVLACNVYIPTSACYPNGNGTPTIADADNDGVADSTDAYPNDPNRAADSYYPSANQTATLAFEDLWPDQGDYDFNDLVLDYRYTLVVNANNEVVDIKGKYVVKAIGGSFKNGFGIQFDFAPSVVTSVSGNRLDQGYANISSNGTESGQSKATIIVFENAFDVLPNPGSPTVNTNPSDPYQTPDTISVTINLGSPQALANLGSFPFNPFIIINQERGKEVHLVDAPATDLATVSYFGTGQDDTNPSNGRYYKSVQNYPWALNIVGGFDYPQEKVDIVEAYTNFAGWAQSGGTQDADWYSDLPGYRDIISIYP